MEHEETRGGAPERIGKLLERLLTDTGLVTPERLSNLETAWREVVGEQIAAHTRIESFRGGMVTVAMDSAPVRQELELVGREELLVVFREKLAAGSGPFVRELRLRVV